MFDKILIANRGEIACRVIKTAHRLGVRSVAVYSEADAAARHVALADEAVAIGPAPARDSYLCVEKVVEAARRTDAQAIHPGYGFLSENAAFAAACADAGLVFIGPPVEAIRAMGSKSAAKQIMEKAGVPLVPGYHGDDQADDLLAAEAERIGYPVLLTASAGGGGKGMRVVESAAEFSAALAATRRESAAAFGDDAMLVEKYLLRPRHVEIQVFADTQGDVVHLFERDCSVQRRHQKVLEEAPAPGLDDARRTAMGRAAIEAARAIGYVGAGTVEFIVDEDGTFYFMEMNTRLQVEHPVTELVTGQDLVEWQLRVAAGEPLPLRQEALHLTGHAFEARIYAEDPARDFLPATGHLAHLRFPDAGPHVRIDTGVREGDVVSIHYDPMIAKLIVWDRDRDAALRRLQAALRATQVVGVTTNLDFLATVAAHPRYSDGDIDTSFIDRHRDELVAPAAPVTDAVLALASLDVLLRRRDEAAVAAAAGGDPGSPWHQTSGWRLNEDNHQPLHFRVDGEEHEVTVHYRTGHFVIDTPARSLVAEGFIDSAGDLVATLDGTRLTLTVVREESGLTLFYGGERHHLHLHDPAMAAADEEVTGGGLTAPMPGKIVAVHVSAGEHVERGAPLLVLEAMKMEHTIVAPASGTVVEVRFAVGEQVDDGDALLVLESGDE
ncbi:MAG: 3-methylcrotonyl-CoA carboxylase [Gammaproteobacteria bacterium]|nr:MAG: 3-methylcrotonyl-CoA carboxylase [Gammaproteobacteria bacterium]